MSGTQQGSTRTSRAGARSRRTVLVEVLAVAVPVVATLLLLLVRPDGVQVEGDRAPQTAPLTSARVVCPDDPRATVSVATRSGRSGSVDVVAGGERRSLSVAPSRVATYDARGRASAVTARGALAPGLVAGLASATGGLRAADCPTPGADAWFTGVGAGAQHRSVLLLTNPDPGRAIVSVTVLGPGGATTPPRLQGLAVAGGGTTAVDLARIVPQRGTLALHVVSDRGRVAALVRDGSDRVGSASLTDYLPAQDAPARRSLLLGLPAGGGGRSVLSVANPGDAEVRATVQLVTDRSTFTPSGSRALVVPPQSVRTLVVSSVLASKAADGTLGLLVTGTGPLTTSLRAQDGDDLALTVPGEGVDAPTLLTVPPGRARVVVGGAASSGVVTVVSRAADGSTLGRRRVEVGPDRAATLALPARTALVEVTPQRATVSGALVVTAPGGPRAGAVVVPLRGLEETALVPQVRPSLP